MILNHLRSPLVAVHNRWRTSAVRGWWLTTAVPGRWPTAIRRCALIPAQTLCAALIAAFLLAAASAWAHHGHPHYFRGSYTHLEGTITEVHWLNPHTWVYLEVAGADGQPTVWALEGAAATTLRREGWTDEMVRVGDTISVRCHPLKDGSPGCLLGYITMENGVEKEFD